MGGGVLFHKACLHCTRWWSIYSVSVLFHVSHHRFPNVASRPLSLSHVPLSLCVAFLSDMSNDVCLSVPQPSNLWKAHTKINTPTRRTARLLMASTVGASVDRGITARKHQKEETQRQRGLAVSERKAKCGYIMAKVLLAGRVCVPCIVKVCLQKNLHYVWRKGCIGLYILKQRKD